MKRIIYPPLNEHQNLRQKLTSGETLVLNFFLKALPIEWEIYIQPHLNGLRPDFVLLNPNVGIAVFEVKDWNLQAMNYFVDDNELMAEKDGVVFSIQNDNPVTKVDLYKKAIHSLYCPRIGINAQKSKSLGAITAGVIFPYANRLQVKKLLDVFLPKNDAAQRYHPISGKEDLALSNIRNIFPEYNRKNSYLMNPQFADDLRSWLVEPDFAKVQM